MLISIENYKATIPITEIPTGDTFVIQDSDARKTAYYMRIDKPAFLLLDSSNRDMIPTVNLKTGIVKFFKKDFEVTPIELEVGVYEHGGKNREDN